MAYTITFQSKAYLAPGLVLLAGEYSCNNSDTVTFTLPSGNVYIVFFTDAQSNAVTTQVLSAEAVVGSVTTYTLTSSATVTGGDFVAICGGG